MCIRDRSQILAVPEDDIRSRRIQLGVEETWEGVHVSGTPDSAYYFSTYNGEDKNPISTDKPKVMIPVSYTHLDVYKRQDQYYPPDTT